MSQVLIRQVPPETLIRLKSRASAQGTSLEEFLRRSLEDLARPSREDVIAESLRLRALTPRRLDDTTPLIRQDRDNDEPYR